MLITRSLVVDIALGHPLDPKPINIPLWWIRGHRARHKDVGRRVVASSTRSTCQDRELCLESFGVPFFQGL
jgi:hypothetical protein